MRTKLSLTAALALAIAFTHTAAFAQNAQPQPPPPQEQQPPQPPPAQQPPPGQYYYPPPPPAQQPQQGQYYYPPPPQQPPQGQYQYPPPPQGQYYYPPPPQGQYQYPPPPQYGYNAEQQERVQKLISEGLAKNKEEIQKAAFYLSPTDKKALYDKNKKENFVFASLMNTLPGFGLGSYLQGDFVFGITQNAMDVVGWTLVIIGVNMIPSHSYHSYSSYYDYDEDDDWEIPFVSGWIVIGASRIMAWIFPYFHEKGYNKILDTALNGGSFSYSIDPLIVPSDKATAVGLAFNLHF